MLVIRPAKFSEHKEICAIAKQHKFTKDFSNMIFSGEDCYEAERIRVLSRKEGRIIKLLGFTCFRPRKRDGVTVLYFIAVANNCIGSGYGAKLLVDLEKLSTGGVELKVNKANPALAWYKGKGYQDAGEAYHGEGMVLVKGIPPKPTEAASKEPRASSKKRK